MAKTTVDNMVAKIKRTCDYNITDSGLDTLLIDYINGALHKMKQLFLDYGLNDEVGATDSFSTVADQEYVDIATETVDFDQPIVLTERTNDNPIWIISMEEYRRLYPDPTADKSSTPDVASFFGNRIYLGPTPSGAITLYLDYIKLITEVGSGDTLPFENKYDPIIVAIAKRNFREWQDESNIVAIKAAESQEEKAIQTLITGASKNMGMNRQVGRRRTNISYFSPRMVK